MSTCKRDAVARDRDETFEKYVSRPSRDRDVETETTTLGEMACRHNSSSTEHSHKIPTATRMFSGSNFLVVVLPVSWDVCSKSKMEANLPEVRKTMLVLQIHVVPKTIQGFMTMYETSKCPTVMADASSYRKSKMAAN